MKRRLSTALEMCYTVTAYGHIRMTDGFGMSICRGDRSVPEWRDGMLQGIEAVFADRVRMMTSLKKKTYKDFSAEFEGKYANYFSEMREYVEQAEDKKAAADEIGECIMQAVTNTCANKRGKLDARSRSEASLFMVYYVFPAILKLGDTGTVIADGVLAACRAGLKNRSLQYVEYDTIYNGFNEKIFGLF